MSRIGKKPVAIPSGVKVQVSGSQISVEGPKGKLSTQLHPLVQAKVENNLVTVSRKSDAKQDKALHGFTRSLIQNLVQGVTNEFAKNLLVEGVGFKAQINGKVLQLSLGFSHPIDYQIPEGIKIETPKPTQITVKGIDRMLVGQTAAEIRRFFEPEPYKGKGVRFVDEQVRRKKGKAVQ
ncbi:MAG: 50S ribosomal protein L6 [Candidatus Omnitrophica bacterium]|nr:50S ribosomal protein L6 [Candidatus Omnitrophota bacterium]